jgi:hypothetical protein
MIGACPPCPQKADNIWRIEILIAAKIAKPMPPRRPFAGPQSRSPAHTSRRFNECFARGESIEHGSSV